MGWQKAILLWFQGKVDIVETHEVVVHSVSINFQVPSIIRLRRFVRHRPAPVIRFSRENVYLRDNLSCQYCGIRHSFGELTLDHVVPVSHGGRKSWTNVVTACRKCNQRKGNRTPDQAAMPLLSRPVIPSWLPNQPLEINFQIVPDSWRVYLSGEPENEAIGFG